MSRTEKDIVSYFPHDSNARNGNTLTILQSRYGNNGYAVWFKLLEKLASTDGHYIDCRSSIIWKLLVAQLGTDEITTVEILNLLVEINAIDKELWQSKLIWCQNLVDNIEDVYKNRRREIPSKPITTDSNPINTDNNGITTDSNPQSKVNKSKVYYSKENSQITELDEIPNGIVPPDPEARGIWEKTQVELQKQVSKPNYNTWFSKTTGLRYKDGQFTLGVPNKTVGEYLQKNQQSLIEKALIEFTVPKVAVVFQVTKERGLE